MILENIGVDVLKTSSFCNFLKEFHFLAKKHLGVRKDLLDSYNKIFENHKLVEEIIESFMKSRVILKRGLLGTRKFRMICR